MAKTIGSNNYTTGYTLTSALASPLTIAAGVTVANPTGPGIYSALSSYVSIANSGIVTAGAYGIDLAAGGGIANLGTALIAGGGGILTNGNLTLYNAAHATIYGQNYGVGVLNGSGTVDNFGTIQGAGGGGLYLALGGTVTNQSHATIEAAGYGVRAPGGVATVTNAGSISSSQEAGIVLQAGGSVNNSGIVAGYKYGVRSIGAGNVYNDGFIISTRTGYGDGVLLQDGGSLGNTGTILSNFYGASVLMAIGTVVNEGTIESAQAAGIYLQDGGSVNNDGIVEGYKYGIRSIDAADVYNGGFIASTRPSGGAGALLQGGGSLGNTGTILSNFYGVFVASAIGTVVNSGTIEGSQGGGIYLLAGGSVNNGGIVAGYRYGIRSIGAANVYNDGFVASTRAGSGFGLVLQGGGSLGNTGTILSDFYGAFVTGAVSTVVNSGTIASYLTGDGAGLAVLDGGYVTNQAGGAIDGKWIGFQVGSFGNRTVEYPAVTLTNFGSIAAADGAGDGAAVWLHGPGVVINEANANIETAINGTISGGLLNGLANGGFGVVAYYQTTLVNYGTIGGTSFAFDAANAGVAVANLIEIAPGSTFESIVDATNVTASSAPLATLDLLSAASAGTVSGFGSQYLGFKTVTLANGADWSLGGTVAAGITLDFAANGTGSLTLVDAGSMQGTIVGFSPHETLALAGVIASGISLSSSNVLTIDGAGVTLAFDPSQNFSATPFQDRVSGGETFLTLECFAAGTRLATEHGSIAVEDLTEGAHVLTAGGETRPIVWIGHRTVDCAAHPNPAAVWPVRVRADAFGPGQPMRDLWLSPDHAVFFDDVLIPVRCLIDGDAIAQERVDAVTYYHVELPGHDVVLAEGLPVESYLETGGRANFANSGGAVQLFPDFGAARPFTGVVGWVWETAAYAPLVVIGPAVERARRVLAMRRRRPARRARARVEAA
jgi:hypothetical protein